jgi:hypothetical protein
MRRTPRTGAESTNCQLSGPDETDFHVGVGFDATTAQALRGGGSVSAADFKRLQQTSIVVEMTPYYRALHHPRWTSTLMRSVVGRQVKVVGQLMADNEHANARDNCAHPDADMNKCWRASMWEIHPVIQFYVCQNEPCALDSTDWVRVDDL